MFYTITQNNSGGRYVTDAATGVGTVIHIEADSVEHAEARFKGIREAYTAAYGYGFDSYCECCGERWWEHFEEEDAKEVPERYWGTPRRQGAEGAEYVHYADGRIEAI